MSEKAVKDATRLWKVEVHDQAEGCLKFDIMAQDEDGARDEASILASEQGCTQISEVIAFDVLGQTITEAILACPPAMLASMHVRTIKGLVGGDHSDAAVEAAMAMLVEERPAIVAEAWYFDDGEGGSEIDPEDVEHWRQTGELVHPISGDLIEHPESVIWREWCALERSPAPSMPG